MLWGSSPPLTNSIVTSPAGTSGRESVKLYSFASTWTRAGPGEPAPLDGGDAPGPLGAPAPLGALNPLPGEGKDCSGWVGDGALGEAPDDAGRVGAWAARCVTLVCRGQWRRERGHPPFDLGRPWRGEARFAL